VCRDLAFLSFVGMALALLLLAAAGSAFTTLVAGPLPVIMMHGVGSTHTEMQTIQMLVETLHPGTVATSLPLYEGKVASLVPLKAQVDGVIKRIRTIVAANATLYRDGWHMVCKSQGGLVCRCMLEEMDDHRVSTFVSLAGPQMGVYGNDFFKFFPPFMQNLTAEEVYRVAYTPLIQDTVSVANIWRDPKHVSQFLVGNDFLPMYNGLRAPASTLARYKHNFIRLKLAVFCVGSGPEYDGGIEPWQSGAWAYPDASGKFVPMKQQEEYTKDLFGLKTLHTTDRLNITVVPGATHADWTSSADLIKAYVLPHLS
jgi:palmitoyl-protein thioesterase